jgi:hypothetical protein
MEGWVAKIECVIIFREIFTCFVLDFILNIPSELLSPIFDHLKEINEVET